MEKLSYFENWFSQWSDDIEKKVVSQTKKSKMFLSKEEFSDIISMLKGFKEICKMRIEKDHKSVVPAGINNDEVENIFLSTTNNVMDPSPIQICLNTNTP